MKFKKIDQYTVRCVLTEEDMIEHNIEIEDFFHDRAKVHDFMEVLIDKAKDEVGYELNEDVLSMQIMPLPKNGLAITITGRNENDLSKMINEVTNIGEMMQEDDDNEDMEGKSLMEQLKNLSASLSDKELKEVIKSQENSENVVSAPIPKSMMVLEFEKMKDVEDLCARLHKPKYITSELYKDEENSRYYLILLQNRLKIQTFSHICGVAIEYGTCVYRDEVGADYVREHMSPLITVNAVFRLRKILNV